MSATHGTESTAELIGLKRDIGDGHITIESRAEKGPGTDARPLMTHRPSSRQSGRGPPRGRYPS